jgi:hypothetical protein
VVESATPRNPEFLFSLRRKKSAVAEALLKMSVFA